MSIEMPAAEVRGLASVLLGSVPDAEEIASLLGRPPQVGGPLQGPVDAFVESHRAAGAAVAGELRWLGSTVSAVADSWLRLDAAIVSTHGRMAGS